MRSFAMRLGMIAFAGSLAACTSSAPPNENPEDCSSDPRVEQYYSGLDHKGDAGNLDFVLVESNPAPPARNSNTWTLQINSMSSGVVGSPVENVQLAITPYMPDHGHGSPYPVSVTAMPTAGQYQLDPVFFSMPGYWETTIQATSPATDSTVFKFCISI
jgi:hypothetical protein